MKIKENEIFVVITWLNGIIIQFWGSIRTRYLNFFILLTSHFLLSQNSSQFISASPRRFFHLRQTSLPFRVKFLCHFAIPHSETTKRGCKSFQFSLSSCYERWWILHFHPLIQCNFRRKISLRNLRQAKKNTEGEIVNEISYERVDASHKQKKGNEKCLIFLRNPIFHS